MIAKFIQLIAQFLGGAAGITLVNASVVALLTPAVIWLVANTDAAALTFTIPPWFKVVFTWGQFSFIAIVLAIIIKIAHWIRSPG